MRRVLVLALFSMACHRDRAADAPPSTADSDALWALAPEGANIGFVASPRAVAMAEHALQDVRTFLGGAPELREARERLESELAIARIGNGTLADAGLSPGKGVAILGTMKKAIAVIPVADRDKFLAVAHGVKGTDFDTVDNTHCKTVRGYYICADDDALFDQIGKGKLADKLGGMRGDLEFVGRGLPFDGATTDIVASAQLSRGAIVVRGSISGLPAKLSEVFGASPVKPRIDADHTAGFGAIDLRPLLVKVPDVPLVAGVTAAQLVKSIGGPVTMMIPAGTPTMDVRIPLSDPAPAATLVEHCAELSALAALGATYANGVCHFTISSMNSEVDLWVEGKELRLGNRTPHPNGERVTMTALGKELAAGEWTLSLWGMGTMYAPVGVPGTKVELPDEAGTIVRAIGMFDEAGVGARLDGGHLTFLFGVRTAWSNPDDVVAKLRQITPEDVLAAKGGEAGKKIADAVPTAPFAQDYKAGYQGLMVPIAAMGMVAGIAAPAVVDYMNRANHVEGKTF